MAKLVASLLFTLFVSQAYTQESEDDFRKSIEDRIKNLKDIEFKVRPNKKVFFFGEEVIVLYSFFNKSKEVKKVFLKHYMGHPFSFHVSVFNEGDTSIIKHSSRHIFSSQLYSNEQMEAFKGEIQPSKTYTATLKLSDVPVYKDGISSRYLPVGTYRIRFSYFVHQSKEFTIEVIDK